MKSHIIFRFESVNSRLYQNRYLVMQLLKSAIDRSILYNVRSQLELGQHKHGERWPCVTVILISLARVLNVDVPFGEQCG